MKALRKWSFAQKMVVSIAVDLVDFFLPPFLEEAWDGIATFLAWHMWGVRGLFAGWEIIEVTSVVDRFVPSLTIIGIVHWFVARKKGRK